MLVGGMPEVVDRWVRTHDFIECQEIQDDIIVSYEDDFPKYRKRVDPVLLRLVMRSAAVQATQKFVYSQVGGGYKTNDVKKALEMLVLAGILIPVTHTDANGIPLGSEADNAYRKILLLDTGLMLRLLNMASVDITQLTTHILTSEVSELVNKGPMAEQIAGLEMLHYQSPNIRHSLFYWLRQSKNSSAEIDYISLHHQYIVPIEVKSGMRGGMKSLWLFMRDKKLSLAIRCSLENFSSFDYVDKDADDAVRHVCICPLYAISMMSGLLEL